MYLSEQRKIMARSLFFVGEIGVNDYFLALMSKQSVDVAGSLVPHIIGTIRSALTVTTINPRPQQAWTNFHLPFRSSSYRRP
jgi:hypothetical protein